MFFKKTTRRSNKSTTQAAIEIPPIEVSFAGDPYLLEPHFPVRASSGGKTENVSAAVANRILYRTPAVILWRAPEALQSSVRQEPEDLSRINVGYTNRVANVNRVDALEQRLSVLLSRQARLAQTSNEVEYHKVTSEATTCIQILDDFTVPGAYCEEMKQLKASTAIFDAHAKAMVALVSNGNQARTRRRAADSCIEGPHRKMRRILGEVQA